MSEPGKLLSLSTLSWVVIAPSKLSLRQILGIPPPVRVSGETSDSSLESRVLPGGRAVERTGGSIVGLQDSVSFNSWWRALKGQCNETC